MLYIDSFPVAAEKYGNYNRICQGEVYRGPGKIRAEPATPIEDLLITLFRV